jgi:hypothetical protein
VFCQANNRFAWQIFVRQIRKHEANAAQTFSLEGQPHLSPEFFWQVGLARSAKPWDIWWSTEFGFGQWEVGSGLWEAQIRGDQLYPVDVGRGK